VTTDIVNGTGILNLSGINADKDVGGTLGNGNDHLSSCIVSLIDYHLKQKSTCENTIN